MDPDEIFTTLKDHAAAIENVDKTLTQLWDRVEGTTNGQGEDINPESVEARLQALENRLNALINKMAWAMKNA